MMETRRYIVCCFLLLNVAVAGSVDFGTEWPLEDRQSRVFSLVSPEKDTVVTEGAMVFVWENPGVMGSSDFRTDHYKVMFWARRKGFGKVFTVSASDSTGEVVRLRLDDCREVFRRHGKYYWRVVAYDAQGNRTTSERRSFVVAVPEGHGRFFSWIFPYAIQFEYVQRLQSPEFEAFLSDVDPVSPFQDFFDLSLVFRQSGRFITDVELQEKFLALSQVGLGFEATSRFRLMRTLYFSLYPRGSVRSCWFSKGLKDYTSTQRSIRVGGDFTVMPKKYLSFRGSWLPTYRIRYSEKDGELRTFEGNGWEFGVRVIISHTILSPFRIFGLEFDFQRIPLEFYYSRVRDTYSGTVMRMARLRISYLLR